MTQHGIVFKQSEMPAVFIFYQNVIYSCRSITSDPALPRDSAVLDGVSATEMWICCVHRILKHKRQFDEEICLSL